MKDVLKASAFGLIVLEISLAIGCCARGLDSDASPRQPSTVCVTAPADGGLYRTACGPVEELDALERAAAR